MRPSLALALAASVLVLLAVSLPAYAQGGLQVSVASQCVVANPGHTTEVPLSVWWPGTKAGSEPLTLSLVGTHPTNVVVNLTESQGTVPLNTTINVTPSSTASAPAAYQVGVVARAGSEEKLVLFTLRVVQAGTESVCTTVGLPIPESTFVVTGTSFSLGLLTQIVTTQVVDLNAERRMKAELNSFNKEKRDATLAKDEAKLEKLKKKELAMRQAQAKVSLARLKVTVITIVPLFLVYYLMASFLGGYSTIVAITPFPIPLITASNGEMVLFWWYFLSSFASSSVLGRLLHTTT